MGESVHVPILREEVLGCLKSHLHPTILGHHVVVPILLELFYPLQRHSKLALFLNGNMLTGILEMCSRARFSEDIMSE